MWKRGGGRSSALDRAQALLSAKRSSRGDAESEQESTAKTRGHTGAVGGSVKTRPASPDPHLLLSDLSELSSVSSAPGHGAADLLGSATPAAAKTQGREGDSTKDLRPQSSLGGGGSRFLKKVPPPAASSSQSPVRRGQMQQDPEPRYVTSSQRSSQTAALSRLAQIESRIRSRKQVQEPKSAENLTSDLGISPPPVAQSLEAPVQLSAQSSSDRSLRGKRFLKSKTDAAGNNSNTSLEGRDVSARSRSRAAHVIGPSAGLEKRSVRVVRGVSLESDEEDMRKLLRDSMDSSDNSFFIPERPSSTRAADKMLSRSSHRVHSSPLPTAVLPSSSNTAPPRSPASPSLRGSPFRYTGQAQAHFSPSVLSPASSPPRASPSPPRRLNSPHHRVGSPQRSLSSMSGRSEVHSLEELFSVGPGFEDPHSEMSSVSSEDFKINVMTLDDLVPATLGFTEETPGKELPKRKEAKPSAPLPGSPSRHRQGLGLKKIKQKEEPQLQQQDEDSLDYQSDFESESRTEPDYSASQVSEHLQGDGDEEEVVSEVREEALDSDASRSRRTEDDYSSTFSDTSRSCTSRTLDRSQTASRSRDSRSYVSNDSRTSRQSRRGASARKDLKEAAVQTQPDPLAYTRPTGMATLGPAVGMTYMDPTPMVAHTLSAEKVEALSTFNPAAFALNEMFKQQLAMIRQFIDSNRHLHSSLVQSLGPPNYRYTTLEDTKEHIHKHRCPKLTVEEALEEVLQEMRDNHHI
ncbi:uncharacterized protein C19orf44 homolog [Epinephelus fuscoguttatus]|uniref:uncharacterized protein C19orf44 homolog n=1 Tax=Epinephelus fuscoguttatus TaxID=293821 RepID=UPI0020D17E7B|nr:uncharacterized protein C19orf44 homolog [Epinephelus fuscoguttatus]